MNKIKRKKINLFFENNGIMSVVKARTPFVNAIPSKIVSKVIILCHAGNPAETYFGVGSGQFFNRFNVHTTIPKGEKFYYPIIFSLSELIN